MAPTGTLGVGQAAEAAAPPAAAATAGAAGPDNGPPANLAGARYDAATGVTHHSHLPVTPMGTTSVEPGGGRGGVVRRGWAWGRAWREGIVPRRDEREDLGAQVNGRRLAAGSLHASGRCLPSAAQTPCLVCAHIESVHRRAPPIPRDPPCPPGPPPASLPTHPPQLDCPSTMTAHRA